MEAIDARIRRVMSDILSVPAETIDEQASPRTIERWDSLRQMNLLVALEEEFSITFEDAWLSELQSFGAIRTTVARVLAP